MANATLWGFTNLKDIMGQRVTTVNTRVLNTAIDASLAEHNRQMAALLGLFATRLTDYQLGYKSASARRLQPLDEQGRARPTKSGALTTVAFPLQSGGDAFGQTFVARAKQTVQEVNDELANMLTGDMRWMRDHLLASLFSNVAWTWLDEQYGSLTIQPLANGDATLYQILNGADAGATDTHYLADSNSIADAHNPYPTIYTELSQHPENAGPYIALIPTDLVATTEALTGFYEKPMPELTAGSGVTQLTATLGMAVPGTVIGWAGGMWIVEWDSLPSTYIVAVAGGAPVKALGLREDLEPELRGFQRVAERDDHPYYESQYLRRAGFGGYNRVGAVCMRIGNGSYSIPVGYSAPIP